MIDFFDRLYTKIDNRNKLLSKLKFYAFLRLGVKSFVNIVVPVYYFFTRNKIENSLYVCARDGNNSPKVIVSLTSFPARIKRVWLVIETILRQTQKPDKIILWLSKEQFPSINLLPRVLLKQRKRGLEIRLVEKDIGSHKKYYYTLNEFPSDYLLIVDDDIFYRSKMIEDLTKYQNLYPNSVIAQYCCQIKWKNGKLKSYLNWPDISQEEITKDYLFFGSGGGTLFPPSSFFEDVLNEELFIKLTPTADDIWLNTMCRLNKVKVTKTRYSSNFLPVWHLFNRTLDSINNSNSKNDLQLNLLRKYYKGKIGVDPFSIKFHR